ncbi:hypothetical protein AMECASPLE_005332 [Ameca splendens]|uniref:Uncharacterized protein n=1 Tax=Ameca splendens TaxID=208324 RepID=A0ABV1A681_9TELE
MGCQNNKVEKNQSKRLKNVPGRPRTETELHCFAAENLTDVFLLSVMTSSLSLCRFNVLNGFKLFMHSDRMGASILVIFSSRVSTWSMYSVTYIVVNRNDEPGPDWHERSLKIDDNDAN